MMDKIYFIISSLLIMIGVVGIFVPSLPGPILVMGGIFLYGYVTDFTVISIRLMIIFGILTLFTILIDYMTSFISAKKFGVSYLGTIGMVVGGLFGFISFNVVGLLAGQFIGIVIGELLSGKHWMSSMKAGSAGIIGFILGIAVNVMIVGVMITLFLYHVLQGG